jgi:iron complex transport system substrate-binding protein
VVAAALTAGERVDSAPSIADTSSVIELTTLFFGRTRRTRACVAALAAFFAWSMGGAAHAAITLRDDRGATVTLPHPPQRIVSLLPSLTESVCALGACERLVGTDRFSNWPDSVAALPKLGGLEDAQVERVVALRPDVVLVSVSARVTDRLEGLGLRVIALDSRKHADVKRTLVLLARMLDRPAEGDRAWSTIERELREAAARVPTPLRGSRVYFEVDATPYAAGPSSFIGETLARLGVANALSPELGAFPKLNPEYVVRLQPDVVMAAQASVAAMRRRPGWGQLTALKAGKVCGLPNLRYELVVRPGPRLGEAAAVLADCLAGLVPRP